MNALLKTLKKYRRPQHQPGRNWFLLSTTFVVALLFSLPLWAQNNIRVQGRVSDEAGQPVAGASVSLKGASIGVNTDDKGNFSLTVPANGILIISSVNFTTTEVPVNNRETIEVKLTSAAKMENEVIVVGYGTQRKEAVTGSVVSISGEKMREVPAANISQALQGRLPGVDISQTSSRPGASTQIRIRGERSLTADNNPLIVLDGIPFPGSLADINPNDIKSIEVLKDASATAIYGSRGANGVILITTEKGQKGRKARITYNGYYGIQTVFSKYPMMNGAQYVALRKAAGIYSTPGADESDDNNTDWQDLFYKQGAVTDHTVNVSGGTETGSYSFGLGYYQNQAVIPTQQYKRYSLRGSLDQQVGKYFRLGFTTNINYNLSEGSQVGVGNVLGLSPIINPYRPDGGFKRTVRGVMDESYVLTKDVVDSLKDVWLNETRGFATYNAIYGEVKIPWVEGLKYRVNLGLDYIQSNSGNFTGQGVNAVNPTTPSSAGISNNHTYHWVTENILSYDRTFAHKHTVNVVALYSAEQNRYNRSSMSARDIPAEDFHFYNLGAATGEKTINPDDQDYQLTGLTSWMGRVMYSYDNRYMLSATLRSDASSRLAPGHKWHTYPAISAGWNISNESFMQEVSVINLLKLRAGYGQTSNQAVKPYATLGRLSARPYNYGDDVYAVGYYVTELPNPSLGWEYSKTVNLGLDFGLLNNRLSGTIEYYVTDTKDILLAEGLPPTSGVSSSVKNIGETQNKGIELSLNGIILDNHNGWTWDAGVNFYANRNRIVALSSGQKRDEGNSWFVGHNINAIYDFVKTGLWQDHDPYLNILEGSAGKVGMIKVKYNGEYNPDGTPKRAIGADDREVMNVDPDFQGGFNTRVSYKGFDLGVVGIFKSGGILISNIHGPSGYINKLTGRGNNVNVDYWTPENTGAKYPNPAGPISNDNPKYSSTLAYFDASYLKVRTISLGYDFSRSLIKNSGVKMRMYFTVQNPFVMFSPFHKESGLDPETNSYGNENVATGGYLRRLLTVGYNTPSTRNYVLGVNMNF
jgi:TonB-linked SusC/RagA family outer membrane protein